MNREDVKRIANDPQCIDGIYNYCDRWCKRCRFRSRCSQYILSEERLLSDAGVNETDDAFWNNVNEMFDITMEMIREIAEEKGINLESVDSEMYSEHQKSLDLRYAAHPCTSAGSAYISMVEEWFEEAEPLFNSKEYELSMKVEIDDLSDEDASGEADEIDNAVEVIQWYQTQIYVKLMRAVRGTAEPDPASAGHVQYDADGSAKVALMGIDRSIASWGMLYNHFSEMENEIIDILVHLDRLRKRVEHAFPHARAFIRPGFDEDVYNETECIG